MSDPLAELQTLADERGLFAHWRTERTSSRVHILLQTGFHYGQRPTLCETVEFPPTNPREAIDALAKQALSYWRAVLSTVGPGAAPR